MSTAQMKKDERKKFHAKVVKHYRKCNSVAETAENFSIAETTVRNICRSAGIVFRASAEEKYLIDVVRSTFAFLKGSRTKAVANKAGLEEWEATAIDQEMRDCGLYDFVDDLREESRGVVLKDYHIMAMLIEGRSAAEIARETGYDKSRVNKVRVAFKDSELWQKVQERRKRQVAPREMKANTYSVIKLILDGLSNVDIEEKLGVDQKYVSKIRKQCRDNKLLSD